LTLPSSPVDAPTAPPKTSGKVSVGSGLRRSRASVLVERHGALLASIAAVAAITLLAWLLFFKDAYLHYDTIYALAWGQDLADGHWPNLEVENAPTPHPLGIAWSAVASLIFGHGGAYGALVVVSALSFALLVWGVYLLGARAFDWRVGTLSALLIGTSYTVLLRGGASFFDVPAAALVVLAGAMEVRRPRRGLPVLSVLAVAGLLRPEIWLFSMVYLAYLVPALDRRKLLVAAAVAVAAPVIWLGMDVVATGEPLYSFTHTQSQIVDVGGPGGPGATPKLQRVTDTIQAYGDHLRDTIRRPVLAGSLLGLFFAFMAARRRARIPFALLVLGTITYMVLGLAGLYLMERFAFLAASMLVIFCSFAALGWIGADTSRWLRRAWVASGVVVLALLVVTAPKHADRLPQLHGDVAERSSMTDDLDAIVDVPAAKQAFSTCGLVSVQSYRVVPQLAYVLDRDPGVINKARNAPPPRGVYLVAATPEVEYQFLRQDPSFRDPLPHPPFPGFHVVARNRSWLVFSRGCA
jgi:hypothetical protein